MEAAKGPQINDTAPDFTADSTHGKIEFHKWIGDGWAILFSHPEDFTHVCTTELGMMAGMAGEFVKRNAKIIGISVDPASDHERCKADIKAVTGNEVDYPLIGDPEKKVAKLYGMLPASETRTEGRTPADNQTVRTVFFIGPDKKVKLTMTYSMTTGRNFSEIPRALDSLQLTAKHQVSTLAGRKQGVDVIVVVAVSDEDALKRFGSFDKKLPYLKTTKQPA